MNVDRLFLALSFLALLFFVATLHPLAAAVALQLVKSDAVERFVVAVAASLTAKSLEQPRSRSGCSCGSASC